MHPQGKDAREGTWQQSKTLGTCILCDAGRETPPPSEAPSCQGVPQIQMLPNPDWCTDWWHHFFFFQLSPAHFRPLRWTQSRKNKKQRSLMWNKLFYRQQKAVCLHRKPLLIVRSDWKNTLSGPLKPFITQTLPGSSCCFFFFFLNLIINWITDFWAASWTTTGRRVIVMDTFLQFSDFFFLFFYLITVNQNYRYWEPCFYDVWELTKTTLLTLAHKALCKTVEATADQNAEMATPH